MVADNNLASPVTKFDAVHLEHLSCRPKQNTVQSVLRRRNLNPASVSDCSSHLRKSKTQKLRISQQQLRLVVGSHLER